MCVCEIETGPGMTQSNVSHQLSALKNSGILDSNKKAQWSYYKISDQFKAENYGLWFYLRVKLIEMPWYTADQEKCRICRGVDLCQEAELLTEPRRSVQTYCIKKFYGFLGFSA